MIPPGGIYQEERRRPAPPSDLKETVMTESARTPLPGATNGCSCCAPAADATAPAGH